MQTNLKQLLISVFSTIMLLTGIACNLPLVAGTGAPQEEMLDPLAREEALKTFNDKWTSLALSTPDETFELVFTEQELTAVLIEQIRSMELDTQSQFFFQNPHVTLENGSLAISGQVQIASFPVNGKAVVMPSVSETGKVTAELEKMEFGGLEFDQSTLANLTDLVESTINKPLYALPVAVSVNSVSIEDGLITIAGSLSQ